MKPQYKIYIGIDTGVQTGICVWLKEHTIIRHIATVKIHQAMAAVRYWHDQFPKQVIVRVEDARKAVFGRQNDYYKAQGAGSVKRDAKIWEDYLSDIGVDFEMVRPKRTHTKVTSDFFKKVSKFNGSTSQHSRDAGMLVVGF